MKYLHFKSKFFRSDWAVILLFVLIDLVFFWKYFFAGLIPVPADVITGSYFPWLNQKWGYAVGVPVKNALMSDVVSLQYPWRKLAIDYLQSGQLPLWDSTSFLGSSLIGNFQAGILNPFNLLFLLPLGFNRIWGLQVVIQPLLAMICMYFMLKNWKLSKLPAIFGAISYAFSAQLLVWVEYNMHAFTTAVFPLFILLLDKYLNAKRVKFLIFISLVIAYSVFVGYPQLIYYFLLFGFLYLLFYARKEKPIINSLVFFIFISLGFSLSAVIFFPGFEALSFSVKNFDIVASENSVLYLPWQNLITAIVPDFFGNPASNNYWGLGQYESLIFYTSIVALPFAAIAIKEGFKKDKVIICLIFLGLVFLLALKTPLSELVQNLEWLKLRGSVSARILFVYGFCISSLAAIGVENFLQDKRLKFYSKYLPLLVLCPVLFGFGLSYIFVKYNLRDLSSASFVLADLLISARNLVIPLTVAISITVVLSLSKFIKNKFLLACLLIILLLLDYFRFSSKYLPFVNPDLIFPTTQSLDFLKQQSEPFRISIEKGPLVPANTWGVYGLENISGYNILLPKNTADYISFLNTSSFTAYSRFVSVENLNSRFLDLANVKYLVALLRKNNSIDSGGESLKFVDEKKYTLVDKEGPVGIYQNNNYFERFYTIQNLIRTNSSRDAFQKLNSIDLKKTAVIGEEPKLKSFSKCDLLKLVYSPQNISLESNCPDDSFLVFSQIFYPGWKAFINGEVVNIIKTNGIFSGIYLPQGQSNIEIYFYPDSFKYGLWVSVGSLVILVVIGLASWRKKF